MPLAVPLAAALVVGSGTKLSVWVADASPVVPYESSTVEVPVAISKFPSARSNKASAAMGW